MSRRAATGDIGSTGPGPEPDVSPDPPPPLPPQPAVGMPVRIHGDIPPEVWNRLGTRLLPKLRAGRDLRVGVVFEMTADGPGTDPLVADLRQILDDLQLSDRVRIDVD